MKKSISRGPRDEDQPAADKMVSFRCATEEWEAFMKACHKKDRTAANVLRQFIRAYAERG